MRTVAIRLALLALASVFTLTACSRKDVLVIGLDATYPPFEFKDPQGKVTGVSVAIGDEIGKTLGKKVEYRNMSFDGLIPALQSGQIDLIISSLTANDQRRQSIDFSDPYVKTGLSILAAKNSTVQSVNDLRTPGRKLAVRVATTGEQWCRAELPEAKLVALDTDAACVLEVVNGTVDAWVYDQVSVMNYHEQQPDRTRALLSPIREEVWAVGLKKNRDELKTQVNETLARMKKEGAFAKLADQYLAKERDLMTAQGLPFVFE
ncbi:amino acid ABC transporter substrate-binding protein (PAAT family) [Prosthecobacter fusiformis]|uniref:Amino acid ABC transporter substrate-binding protein (PAAT family) n=1 Tax=Prosthecobacter fusiformis TaxID=48464 RepID=A0A4R7RMS6_9BACT|nr:transporter substrate-binding domain-containing protein [Prosthecobacter fusiformis]TDU66652.1 amino acid ABC transporter substrate-binding protein (PAAT family) [Prosthecobacter fusiformis]